MADNKSNCDCPGCSGKSSNELRSASWPSQPISTVAVFIPANFLSNSVTTIAANIPPNSPRYESWKMLSPGIRHFTVIFLVDPG
jgi:hypothetical protein